MHCLNVKPASRSAYTLRGKRCLPSYRYISSLTHAIGSCCCDWRGDSKPLPSGGQFSHSRTLLTVSKRTHDQRSDNNMDEFLLVSRLHVRETRLRLHLLRGAVLLLHQSLDQMERLLVHFPGTYCRGQNTSYVEANTKAHANVLVCVCVNL